MSSGAQPLAAVLTAAGVRDWCGHSGLPSATVTHAVFLAAVLAAFPTLAWGPEGHRVVAEIAEQRLSPSARANVNELLKGHSLASVSGWADQVRRTRPQTKAWHYVDIPLEADSFNAQRDCPHDCIVRAINFCVAELRNPDISRPARVQALMWLVHLAGDISQPLHTTERAGDRGGNTVAVTFYGRRENLHQVWDSGLLEFSGSTERELVAELSKLAATLPAESFSDHSAADWANESHALARKHAYADLPADLVLLSAYEAAELPVAKLQLARAGARLAAVLNAVWP